MAFAVGDVVELKSGSLWMTVVQKQITSDSVITAWFGMNQELKRGLFPEAALRLVPTLPVEEDTEG